MLPELLWEPNSGPRCMLLTAEPWPQSCSSFSAGRVVSPELCYRYPHSNTNAVTVTEYSHRHHERRKDDPLVSGCGHFALLPWDLWQGGALSQGEHGRGNCKLHCRQEATTEEGLGSYALQGFTSTSSCFLHTHPKTSLASNNIPGWGLSLLAHYLWGRLRY